jgi:N-acyl-D-aspartate/D-glutamate deacylase
MARFDTLIHGGRIMDASGNPWLEGDVALSGDSCAAIAPPGQTPHTLAVRRVMSEAMEDGAFGVSYA